MIWAQFATDLGDLLCASAVAAVVAIWVWAASTWSRAAVFAFSYGLAMAAVAGGKWLSGRFFPNVTETTVTHFSRGAPSGHVTLSVLVYGAVAYFCAQTGKGPARLAGLAGGALIIVAVVVTRVTLGAHTIPDAISGLVVGGIVLSLMMRLQQRDGRMVPRISPVWLLIGVGAACAAFSLSGIRVEDDFGLF